ncbi:hypothetical protein TNCV_2369721 [Trichonephila clavipes]|nr:hypothetical protein TNCV_2369721 [Trichonephila clavipes]
MIVGSSGQKMVQPQDYRVPDGDGALLTGKTTVFGVRLWILVLPTAVCGASGVKTELIPGGSGDPLGSLMKVGSALVSVMVVCWSEGGQGKCL